MRSIVLEETKRVINGERNNQYGSPEDNFKKIASYWSMYLSKEIKAEDVAILMALLKIARMQTGVYCKDNYIDAIGYLACGYEVSEKGEIIKWR